MSLTPQEYAFWPNPESPTLGLLLCLDGAGNRVTAVSSPATLRLLLAGSVAGALPSAFPHTRAGWPDDWSATPAGARRAAEELAALAEALTDT